MDADPTRSSQQPLRPTHDQGGLLNKHLQAPNHVRPFVSLDYHSQLPTYPPPSPYARSGHGASFTSTDVDELQDFVRNLHG
jgi:hypothetical protein